VFNGLQGYCFEGAQQALNMGLGAFSLEDAKNFFYRLYVKKPAKL
jgi:hypothetical protein